MIKLDSNKKEILKRVFWIAIGAPIGIIVLTILSLSIFGDLPTFEELENPKSNLASEIISTDNQVLGKFFKEDRTVIDFKDVTPNLVNALIATEDSRYRGHCGIDFWSYPRVIFGVLTGSSRGGGSTVTQQLAKNLFPRDTTQRSKIGKMWTLYKMKIKEWITAVKLERNYTKEEIIAMYLNTVSFGYNAYGIKSAARTYFNTVPDSLKIEEAAMLVGLLKAPTRYSPVKNPENALRRRNTVLEQMYKYDYISEEQLETLKAKPIKLDIKIENHNSGLSTYFREFLRYYMTRQKPNKEDYENQHNYEEAIYEWETNPLYGWCNKNTSPGGKPYDLYKDGIKIYTTINSKMQDYAEQAMRKHMGKELQPTFDKEIKGRKNGPFAYDLTQEQKDKIMWMSMRRSDRYRALKRDGKDSSEIVEDFNTKTQMRVFAWNKKGYIDTVMTPYDSIYYYKRFLNCGFISMEPKTGNVRAYVGGINYEYFKYDHVKLSKRQVGSTFKPIVYTMGMLHQISPCTRILNVPYTIPMPEGQAPYTPRYSKSKLDGQYITLRTGLALSLNQISAWTMRHFKPEKVAELAKNMGIKSWIDPVPAMCVGSAEVTLFEMVGAYGAFPNKGVHSDPIFVTRIEDRYGNTIAKFNSKKSVSFDEQTAYLMVYMLQGVVSGGTASRLIYNFNLKNPIAGKTGTTNNNSDGWFIGFTPDLVSGAWVGGEERSIHFVSGALGMGANMALPIWGYYMQKVLADKSLGYTTEGFDKPSGNMSMDLDCDKYNRENSGEDPLINDEFFQ